MTASNIIAIRTSSGTVKAGLKSFISLFEKRTDIKEVLKISNEDIESIKTVIDIMGKIYIEVDTVEIE